MATQILIGDANECSRIGVDDQSPGLRAVISLVGHRQLRLSSVAGVDVVTWNPRRSWRGRPVRLMRLGRHVPGGPRVNNFGDLLGPQVVRAIHRGENLGRARSRATRLLAIGSILHFATDGDTVWGVGVNGNALDVPYAGDLDIRAVRGPLTRDFLQSKGSEVPEVYGDPGLLVTRIGGAISPVDPEPGRTIFIPNLNDLPRHTGVVNLVAPTRPLAEIVEEVLRSELVLASSLHGIVLAEALGRPAQLVRSDHEAMFKYEDYYLGSGRSTFRVAPSPRIAEQWGGEPAPAWDPQPLIDAFPRDLWLDGPAHG